MNVKVLTNRVIADPLSVIQPSQILSKEEIDADAYLVSAFYNKNNYIRLVTAGHIINEHINGEVFPKVKRNVDIPDYAYDMILEQGRALIFIEPISNYAILKEFSTKRFLTFGDQRQLPFGLSNFVNPLENLCGITRSFRYGDPIVILEGLRDCLDMQTVYPYVLAMQTAGIPSAVKRVLSTLTNHLILAFDNDDPGNKATRNIIWRNKKLQEHNPNGEQVYLIDKLNYPNNYKDVGTLSQLQLANPFEYQFFKNSLYLQIQAIIG